MSILITTLPEALRFIENHRATVLPRTLREFFDIFSKEGCLMKCETELLRAKASGGRALQSIYHQRDGDPEDFNKLSRPKDHCLLQDWFEPAQIIASAARGCGSCNALRYMIEHSFTGGLSKEYEYMISDGLELKRRLPGISRQCGEVEIVQLFRPPGRCDGKHR
jgi:hypothetical protein